MNSNALHILTWLVILSMITMSAPVVPVLAAEPSEANLSRLSEINTDSAYKLTQLEDPLYLAVQRGLAKFKASTIIGAAAASIQLEKVQFDGKILEIRFVNVDVALIQEADWNDLQHAIDMEVTQTLYDVTGTQGANIEYQIWVNGNSLQELVSREDPKPPSGPKQPQPSPNSIQGSKIVLNPGHGYFTKDTGGWFLQRSYYFGIVEDFINLDLTAILDNYIAASGGNPMPDRQVNKNAGNHLSGHPWWQMGASEYVRSLGAPESVWRPLPYNFSYQHDVAARPEYANWVGANSMVSIHNNGGGSPKCNSHGTEIWYDTSNGYSDQSLALANAIHNTLIKRIRESWDASWCDRGVKGAPGTYGENRRFRGPGVLVELAFMDVATDNSALQNSTFQKIAMAAINEGLVQYNNGVSCPAISAWRGEYWNNTSLDGYPVMCQNDNDVNFQWGLGGPGGSVLSDNFSARWTRTINFPSGNYRFHVKADDGVRLWIDNTLVIDKFIDQVAEYAVEKNLEGGDHTFKVEYYERRGAALVKLWWEQVQDEKLISASSAKCLNVSNGSMASGALITQFTCNGADYQTWDVVPVSSGYYELIARNSGKCLDVQGDSILNSARLIQKDCDGTKSQLFSLTLVRFGYYRLVNKNSGKCAAVSGYSLLNGAIIIQRTCNNLPNQQWSRVPISPP